MNYECVKAKSLLSKKEMTADSWFHINRSLNAYRGCEHGCVYCDGMNEYYHVDNFMSHIRIKENAPVILRKELKKLGFTSQKELETETLWSFLPEDDAKRLAMKTPRRIVIGVCGGVSDGFQPAEIEHKITQQILESIQAIQEQLKPEEKVPAPIKRLVALESADPNGELGSTHEDFLSQLRGY